APARAARAVRGTRAGGGGRRPAALHARARVRRRRRRGAARPRPVEGGDGATAGRPRAHPARSLARLAVRTLGLLGLVPFLLVVTGVASRWMGMGAKGLGFAFKFSRVYNRVFEILLVLAILLAWRRLDLGYAKQIGLRHPRWARDLGRGLVIGVLGVLVGVV